MMAKAFFLIDCNNFYVSCERVFDPALEGRPVIVMSNNDGCVIARSNEVKEIGVRMGTPVFECRGTIKKHRISVFSSNYTLYADMSRRVMDTLERFSPEVEVYSIDEAFLLIDGSAYNGLTEYGRLIKNTVKRWTGVPVSVGIGSTKTLAKAAAQYAKKHNEHNGVFDISGHRQQDEYMDEIEVGDVWGVGRRYAKMLNENGISTALQLRDAPDEWVRKRMSVAGLHTVWELRGTPCVSLEQAPPPKKCIISSRSFGVPAETLADLKEAVAVHASRAAEKMRSQRSIASCISVFIKTNKFSDDPQYSNSATSRLSVPSSHTPELISHVHNGLERIYRAGYRYKKAGVMLTDIVPEGEVQLNLLAPCNSYNRNRALMRAVDGINARWGSAALRYAAAGVKQRWQMRRSKLSNRYTTQWSELPVARASFPAL